jgi:hypothetical protein
MLPESLPGLQVIESTGKICVAGSEAPPHTAELPQPAAHANLRASTTSR